MKRVLSLLFFLSSTMVFGQSLQQQINTLRTTKLNLDTYTTNRSLDLFNLANKINIVDTIVFQRKRVGFDLYPNTDKGKLAGITPGATANSTDAALRDRSTHTGTQPASSIIGTFGTAQIDTTSSGVASKQYVNLKFNVQASTIATHTGQIVSLSAGVGTAQITAGQALTTANAAQASIPSILATTRSYSSVATGISSTTSSQYFTIPQTGNAAFDVYRNDSGAATYINSYPSSSLLYSTQSHGEVATVGYDVSKGTSLVRTSGSVDTYLHAGITTGGLIGTNTGFANKLFISYNTASPGFANGGILTELRVGPTTTTAAGAKIQAWIVRPVSLSAGTFSLVSAVGELDATVMNRWYIFRGLSIPVRAGDMIAVRAINISPSYWTGSAAQNGFSYVFIDNSSDLTINSLNAGIPPKQGSGGGAVMEVESEITTAPSLAANVPGGRVTLDNAGYIHNRVGRAPDMVWQGKKIIWVGTSIPANYGATSYPALVGSYLNANLVNESVGSSGMIWDGTRALTLSATQAELNAAFPGNASQSYEVKLIGKGADLVVFDHGFNDRDKAVGNLGTLSSTDRTTFYGAFNYVINALYQDNPNVRIAFVTPPSRYASSSNTATMDATRNAILALADKYGAPIIDLMKVANFSAITNPTFMADGLHPTQASTYRLATICYKAIVGINALPIWQVLLLLNIMLAKVRFKQRFINKIALLGNMLSVWLKVGRIMLQRRLQIDQI